MVNKKQNHKLTSMHTIEELTEVGFSMNPISVACSYGMKGYFFQKCWGIIQKDLMGVIRSLFSVQMISKYFSRSCIVLFPKVNNPSKINDFRHIILRKFTIKIISKLNVGSNVIIKFYMGKS